MFTIFTLSNPLDFPLHTTYCTHIDKAPIIFEHIRLHFMSRLLFSNRNSSIFKPKAIQYSQYLYWVTHWIIAKNGVACSYFRLLKKKNTKYFLGLRTWWGEMCQQKTIQGLSCPLFLPFYAIHVQIWKRLCIFRALAIEVNKANSKLLGSLSNQWFLLNSAVVRIN